MASPPLLYDLPALVLGNGITPLGTIRALARLGISCQSNASPNDIATKSRWFAAANLKDAEKDLAKALRARDLPAVVFPCSDTWVHLVAGLSPDLRQRYRASVPAQEIAEQFLDKNKFRILVTQHGTPHPRTFELKDEKDLDTVDHDAFSDMFIKPRDSQRFFSRFGVKAWRTRSKEEARQKFNDAQQEQLEVVLQEYIPGPASNHIFIDGFIDRNRAIKALFARTRLRIYPPDFGNSTFMKSIALNDVSQAAQSLQKLLPASGYRGIFSAEFKRDERDGTYRILEVNIRPWWYVGFAVHCGVNVIELAYRDALEMEVPPVTEYREGAKCLYPYYDLACLRETGQFHLFEWVGDLLGSSQPVFCFDDPWPAIWGTAKLLKRK